MRKNQAMMSELAAVGFGMAICIFGLVMPLLLCFVVAVARLVFCTPNMWSGFRVSFTLSIAVFVISLSPEMAFVTMAYGLAGALMGQTAKQLVFPPHRLKTRFPQFSYAGLMFLMTALFSVAQTVQYSFYGRMLRVSAGRLQEHLILDAFDRLKEVYEKMGLWSSLGVDEAMLEAMAELFRVYMPAQIVLSGFVTALLCALIFPLVIPMAPVFKKMLKKHWGHFSVPLSWIIGFGGCAGLLVLCRQWPAVAVALLNITAILAGVFAVSGFVSAKQWLAKYISSAGLCFAVVLLSVLVLLIYTGAIGALGVLMIFVIFDSYKIYKNNKKKIS